MSALGQKRTCAVQNAMSALPPTADICSALADVRFVPIATNAPQQIGRSIFFLYSVQIIDEGKDSLSDRSFRILGGIDVRAGRIERKIGP
jgi:hypothetical protein